MFSIIQSRFRDRQQFRQFGMLAVASFFCGLMVLGRSYLNRHHLPDIDSLRELAIFRAPTFLFLIWNLFLAWVPYLMALKAGRLHRLRAGKFRLALCLFVWLAFLPNAPYILTDFVHFRHMPPVPFWYDLALFFTTASLGMTLGLLSLYEVHQLLKRWFSKSFAALMILFCIGLSGFGVWLGRFQRWNSWDIVTRPEALFRDIVQTLTTRHELIHAMGISVLLSCVLLVGYGLLVVLLDGRKV